MSFELIAGWASIIGALLSLEAVRQARSASSAAKAARDAVISKTIAEEIQSACAQAGQLVEFLHQGRYAEAGLRTRELLVVLSEVPHRRSAYLDGSNRDNLLNVRAQLQILSDKLAELGNGTVSLAEQARMLKTATALVVTKLHETLGKVKTRLDMEQV